MSPLQQLNYVNQYFSPYIGKLNNYQDLYLAVFCPDGLGQGPDYILGSSQGLGFARAIAKQNHMSSGEFITVADFRRYAGQPPANLGNI